jgi:hypothetical protein
MVGAMLVLAGPASAAIPEAGPRISLFGPPTTYPANTPFHVTHGFFCGFDEAGCPQTNMSGGLFNLYADGVLQPSKVQVFADSDGINEVWVTNFWDGLPAGRHTLVGVWTQKGVVVQTLSVTIRFT